MPTTPEVSVTFRAHANMEHAIAEKMDRDYANLAKLHTLGITANFPALAKMEFVIIRQTELGIAQLVLLEVTVPLAIRARIVKLYLPRVTKE